MTLGSVKASWISAIACIAVCGVCLAYIWTASPANMLDSAKYLVVALLIAFCLCLPVRSALGVAAAGAVIGSIGAYVSRSKLEVTELPLTFFDLKIATSSPGSFLDAMKFPRVGAYLLVLAVAIAIIGLLVLLVREMIGGPAKRTGRLLRAGLGVATVGATVSVFSNAMSATIVADEKIYEKIWEPEGVSQIWNRLGTVPFLILTYSLERALPDEFMSHRPSAGGPAPDLEAARHFIEFPPNRETQPNIAVILLESAFDIGLAFDVEPAPETTLTSTFGEAQLRGQLQVNTVGGGTWISEFETITGLDSRFFGYSGYYTHVSIAPYIQYSLVNYLRERGYRTRAYNPVEGEFYGARQAYAKYGFQAYMDAPALDIEEPWSSPDDKTFEKFIADLKSNESGEPSFVYALTISNHSPHRCRHFEPGTIKYRFAGDQSFEQNCELNEYMYYDGEAERAVNAFEQYLKDLEQRTGRPYVLLLFGDHQPHTFTGTGNYSYDYSGLRKQSKHLTFYQFRSSVASPFKLREAEVNIASLPTLLSAYVARDYQDLYLPANLGMLYHCGAQIDLSYSLGFYQLNYPGGRYSSEDCSRALDEALNSYSRAGFFR